MIHFVFASTLHILLAIYLVGIPVTWAVTHIIDGYRRERGYGGYRDGMERGLVCLFWPLVFAAHRFVNVIDFVFDVLFDGTVRNLRAIGHRLGKRK